jgi:60Kd inner membrane protein
MMKKLSVSLFLSTLLCTTADAFAPPRAAAVNRPVLVHGRHASSSSSSSTSRFMATQQHDHFADISSMIQTFTSMTMADAGEQQAPDAGSTMAAMMDQLVNAAPAAVVAPVVDSSGGGSGGINGLMDKLMDSAAPVAVSDAAATTTTAATAAAVAVATQTAAATTPAAAGDGGWFGFLSAPPAVDAVTSAVATTPSADEAALAATAAAATAADNGWFGFLTAPIAVLIQVIHGMLVAVGLDSNAWGISIILLTLLIKVVTFPLTKTQLESTNKMQAMQPAIKEIQAKYQSNQEVMNQKMAEFYQQNDINPLAGCLPSLVQIPVFIGLYRAVLQLASANELDEPFLFLPNLEGPTYGADPAHGSDWLFGEW